jgi:Leucine-rich repeat (LRR) protein
MTTTHINEKNNQIKDLIRQGEIQQAIFEICDFAAECGLVDNEQEATSLSARFRKNEADAVKGIKRQEDVDLDRNIFIDFAQKLLADINRDALDKIRKVEASEKLKVSKEIEMALKSARVLDDYHLTDIIKRAEEFKLEELDLSGKAIDYLPKDIARLHYLKKLNLSHNQFKELPPFIGKLSALVSLDISYNQLTELPCELGDLIDLEELIIDNNPLQYPSLSVIDKGTDSILRELAKKSKSKQKDQDAIFEELEIGQVVIAIIVDKPEYGLFLSYKGLEGLLHKNNTSKSILTDLEDKFIGEDVEVVVNNKMMINGKRRLAFSTHATPADNHMRAAVKNRADNMINQAIRSNTRILDLSGMGFDMLSKAIGKCTNLELLYLNNNKLAVLPDEICDLPQLKRLYLHNNNLTKLPDEIGKIENLETLNLENNKIAKLPASLVKLDDLVDINISGNPCAIYLPGNDVKEIKSAIAESLLNIGENELDYSRFKLGEVLVGQIKLIYNYGVFIRVVKNGDYKEGLLHKSSTTLNGKDYWRTLHKFFKIGDKLEVRILEVQPENNRVTFSLHDNFPAFITNRVYNMINTAKNNRYSRLDFSNAEITTVPKEIGELEQLEELDLRFNPIKTLPAEIKNLKNLKTILIDNISPEIAGKGAPGIIDYFLDK